MCIRDRREMDPFQGVPRVCAISCRESMSLHVILIMLLLESARPARATAGCGMIVTASARMGCARIGDVRAVSGHAISDRKLIHVYHHEDVVECVGMYICVDIDSCVFRVLGLCTYAHTSS